MGASDTITKTQRWLDLIAYLVGRRQPATFSEVMQGVPSYARRYGPSGELEPRALGALRQMFERDKRGLRAAGIPIRSVRIHEPDPTGSDTGYELAKRDFYLPYLRLMGGEDSREAAQSLAEKKYGRVQLTLEEAETARRALHDVIAMPDFPFNGEARSALGKLSFDLPRLAREDDAGSPYYAEPPGTEDLRRRIGVLARALLDRKTVRFTYHGIRRGAATEREVSPYGMLFHAGQWYLVGRDALRDAERIFRVGRMDEPREVAPGASTAQYEIPDDFTLETWRTRDAWELGSDDEEVVEAGVAFAFPRSLWAERNGKGTLVERRPDGSQLRSFEVRQPEPFLRWILSLGGEARIEAPDGLARALEQMVRDVLALYEPAGDRGADD